ncbi:MAG TPA: hypothetical protein VFX79_02900 [Candidatus Saccharimonadales bacterium]|nr:hypothetical protein [Candidatus Saccharimonadales bacterium]
MAAPTSHPLQNPENLESRLDNDVRILPKPGNDVSQQDSMLLAFDSQTQRPLTGDGFLARLEHTFGVRAESRVQVPLTWVDGGRIITPQDSDFFEKTKAMRNGPGELGGYFGIRLSGEGMDKASNKVAAGIAALISEMYHDDEQLRLLHNYTLDQPVEPIEITGPGYNLAEEATDEHPLIDLKEILGHPVSIRHQAVAPELARVSFA